IQVYQIDQVYFVLDGNHRVSIARQSGAPDIQAYVVEVRTKVPLSPDVQPDDLIIKAEYVDFLEHTSLDKLCPEADLSVTVPGRYQVLEEHIKVYHYFMGLEQEREIPYEEAVAHWYNEIYLPIVQVIRQRGILRDFPGRTETDLYLWVSEHRLATRRTDQMFADLVVAINGAEAGWRALEHALFVAQHEGARVHGLHVAASETQRESKDTQTIRVEFDRRCQEADVPGELAVEVGKVPRSVCWRARWADLVILSLSYPPAARPIARLGSGLSAIIRCSPRPVLMVPETAPHLSRALLAYDGSPKSEEALFVATYLSVRWEIPLVVVTVIETGRTTSESLLYAQKYLETRGCQATFVKEHGPVAEKVVGTAEGHDCDLIIMGGYGFSPALEVVLGSAVDEVLRTARRPTLICR
ncbi:MAG: hypothetical protein B6I35_11675, partial [Anaerolineaceae bacterium 4572_32.2]